MKKILIFIAGVLVGAVLFAGGQATLHKETPVHVATSPEVVKAAERALAREKQREGQLDLREAMVQAEEEKLASSAATPAANPSDATGKGAPNAAMSKLIKAAIDQQMEMQINSMKTRLQLTDEQEKAVRDLLDKQSEEAQAMGEKMLEGKLSRDELKAAQDKQMAGSGDVDQQMQDILSPDQFTEYKSYQNDQKKTAAETQANLELSQVQGALQLSDDQKDKVFTAIYQQYAQQMGVDGAKSASGDIDQQFEAKKTAMQSVLTPEQFDTYSKFVDSQKKMVNALTSPPPDSAAPGQPASQ